ncbi:MAG: peptidoglycan DD-metalloendopeptidase family protein [Clostridia bacterium]|nr:peptidoglycan DD-metalloendopeptidase family protein [Clostridia bacterium]
MKEKDTAIWARIALLLHQLGYRMLWLWDLIYRYHYWLGVAVLRRLRRVIRLVSRVTWKPRRFLRYAWMVAIYRPVHRFFHRMWRLISGLPRSYKELWVTMKKDALNILLLLPRGILHWLRDYKEEWFTLGRFLCPIAAAVVLTTTIHTWSQTRFCLALSYRGQEIGMIENAAVYDRGASMARSRVTNVGAEFKVDAVPTLTMVMRGAKSTMTADEVCDAILSLSYESKDIMEATAIYMDDEFLGVVDDGDALQGMLDEIKDSMSGEDVPGQRVEFVQDIRIETALYPVEYDEDGKATTLKTVEEIHDSLTTKTTVEQSYEVKSGDTFSGIAKKHNMTEDQLKTLNPDIKDVNKLQIGQELLVQRPQYRLQVAVVKSMTEKGVKVPYNTRTVYRNDKYTDWSSVKTKGVDGKKTVVTEVTMLDGYVIQNKVVEEIVTLDPVTKVVEVGTKKRPSSSGSSVQGDGVTHGNMTWPVPICRNVYQGYHSRHKAIDISSGPVPVRGKPAVAADGGVVIQASTGWNGGYGTVVKIQHSNGLITVYAHLQSLSVKEGQRVTRGQQIGLIGNTGNSFGPHLHFEVIKNGVKVNPLNYVSPSK